MPGKEKSKIKKLNNSPKKGSTSRNKKETKRENKESRENRGKRGKRGKSNDENKIETKARTTQENKPPKFKFVCQVCGDCCKSEEIIISIADLQRWVANNTIFRVMHLLKITGEEGSYKIILKKDDDGYCNLYHRDNKLCTIYDTRPLICRAFPLVYDGSQYKLKTKNCKGLYQEGMTKDQLKAIRDDAFEGYIAFRQIGQILPVLYGLIFNKLIEDSQEFMQKMSESENTKDLDEMVNEKMLRKKNNN